MKKSDNPCSCFACSFSHKKKPREVKTDDYSMENLDRLAFKRKVNQIFDELLNLQAVKRLRMQRAERMKEKENLCLP